MASFPGRTGRRRRVLNEELLSASTFRAALRAGAGRNMDPDAPRYCEAAGVENGARVTDLVPRGYGSLLLLAIVGLASVAGLAALDHWAGAISRELGMRTAAPLDFAAPGSLATWLATVLLLVCGAMCLLVYSIRRHRIDDFRGRYRVWLAAAAVEVMLSVNSVAGLHRVLADAATYCTGWWALRDGAAWWLVVAGVPVGWVLWRALSDVAECRLAASAVVMAAGAYAAAVASYLGWSPVGSGPRTEPLVTVSLMLVGHWMMLLGVTSYARYVVLDAQGLVAHRRRQVTPSPPESPAAAGAVSAAERPQAAAKPRPTEWVDGRRPVREPYGDDQPERGGRKLSKSERKRLRKLKARNRAA